MSDLDPGFNTSSINEPPLPSPSNLPEPPLFKALGQSQSTGVMEYVRRLEGTIKQERLNFAERVNQEVAWRVYGTRGLWIVTGMVLGYVPWLIRLLWNLVVRGH